MTGFPSKLDQVVAYHLLDTGYWHPGGLSIIDTMGVVPLENSDGQSRIRFLDLTDVAEPRPLSSLEIVRSEHRAGACAITNLNDAQLLLAVWSDSDHPASDGTPAQAHLDIYIQSSHDREWSLAGIFFPSSLHRCNCKFQSMDFVWEEAADRSRRLFLVCFENISDAQPHPLDPGTNCVCAFEVALDLLSDGTPLPRALDDGFLTLQLQRHFCSDHEWCNMDAGTSLHASGGQLMIYCVHHFLSKLPGRADLALKMLEFSQIP